jgi:hypothetical protein
MYFFSTDVSRRVVTHRVTPPLHPRVERSSPGILALTDEPPHVPVSMTTSSQRSFHLSPSLRVFNFLKPISQERRALKAWSVINKSGGSVYSGGAEKIHVHAWPRLGSEDPPRASLEDPSCSCPPRFSDLYCSTYWYLRKCLKFFDRKNAHLTAKSHLYYTTLSFWLWYILAVIFSWTLACHTSTSLVTLNVHLWH